MTSVKLKFITSSVSEEKGTLHFQITHDLTIRRINTYCHILASEWKEYKSSLIARDCRTIGSNELKAVRKQLLSKKSRLEAIIRGFESRQAAYTTDDVISAYFVTRSAQPMVFGFFSAYSNKLRSLGRLATASNADSSMRSFMDFRNGKDLTFAMLTADVIELYEAYLKQRGVTRNTSSFYMRAIRAGYRIAVEKGLAPDIDIFKKVYTGVDKTIKRAITLKEMKSIVALDLSSFQNLEVARDLFLFSFYARGMSFIDLAYLRKKDIVGRNLLYRRSKTRQAIDISVEMSMQRIINKYPNDTQYLLPIITREDGTERTQYKSAMISINQKLKKIGKLAKIEQPISMYTARHTWATIARQINVPLSVISEGLGHDNDRNTQIYLASIKTSEVDRANHKIIAKIIE